MQADISEHMETAKQSDLKLRDTDLCQLDDHLVTWFVQNKTENYDAGKPALLVYVVEAPLSHIEVKPGKTWSDPGCVSFEGTVAWDFQFRCAPSCVQNLDSLRRKPKLCRSIEGIP
jgi:hypothetical protein